MESHPVRWVGVKPELQARSGRGEAESLGKVPLPAVHNDFDADEGFYDKPSISPTNSID